MADKSWKQVERRVASLFNTLRTPLSGGNGHQTRSDTLSKTYFIEAKHRKRHATVTLWYEVNGLAKKEGKVPVVVLAEKGRHRLFVVAPLESRYLRELADVVARGEVKTRRIPMVTE